MLTPEKVREEVDTTLTAFAQYYEASHARYGTWSVSPFRNQILALITAIERLAREGRMKHKIENCYQCLHYQACFLRKGIDDLLDEGHHKEIVEGKSVLSNSISLPFFEELAKSCNLKEKP